MSLLTKHNNNSNEAGGEKQQQEKSEKEPDNSDQHHGSEEQPQEASAEEAKEELLKKAERARSAAKRLMDKYSSLVQVRGKKLRVFHSPHEEGRPTIFFFHGLYSRLEHWEQQIVFYHKRLTVVAVDLVGHGLSDAVDGLVEYKTWSIVQDLIEIFAKYAHKEKNVLVGHSYATSLICKMYRASEEVRKLTSGIVFCSPTITGGQERRLQLFGAMPRFVVDVCRFFTSVGGTNSSGVTSRVGERADETVRQQQLELNASTPSSVIVNAANGATYAAPKEYEDIACHVLLIVGELDTISPPADTIRLYKLLECPHGPHIIPGARHNLLGEAGQLVNALINKFIMKKCDMPFLVISEARDADTDQAKPKWALKNHEKWKATPNGSRLIGAREGRCAGFRACKVLRQDDPDHSPSTILKQFPNVGLIIDISKDIPPYLTTDEALPMYKKVPIMSKVAPSMDVVNEFVAVAHEYFTTHPGKEILVHCHYGFNRTGFMICAYLIAKCGYTASEAAEEFCECRPPGIKHQHFVDALQSVKQSLSP